MQKASDFFRNQVILSVVTRCIKENDTNRIEPKLYSWSKGNARKKEQDGIVNESFFIRWLESTAETYKHTTQIREIAQNIKCWLLQVFVSVRMYSGYV